MARACPHLIPSRQWRARRRLCGPLIPGPVSSRGQTSGHLVPWKSQVCPPYVCYAIYDSYSATCRTDIYRATCYQKKNTCVYPAAALVCDFVKTPDDEPQLLTYDQPVQLLHELGHSIREVVSRTRYARFHGASVTAIDFGEAHSLLLKKWFFLNEAGIRRLTRHYSTLSPSMTPTPTPTTDKIIQAILTYQKVYCGPLFHLYQLVMAKFDLDSHLAPSAAQNTEIDAMRTPSFTHCGQHYTRNQ